MAETSGKMLNFILIYVAAWIALVDTTNSRSNTTPPNKKILAKTNQEVSSEPSSVKPAIKQKHCTENSSFFGPLFMKPPIEHRIPLVVGQPLLISWFEYYKSRAPSISSLKEARKQLSEVRVFFKYCSSLPWTIFPFASDESTIGAENGAGWIIPLDQENAIIKIEPQTVLEKNLPVGDYDVCVVFYGEREDAKSQYLFHQTIPINFSLVSLSVDKNNISLSASNEPTIVPFTICDTSNIDYGSIEVILVRLVQGQPPIDPRFTKWFMNPFFTHGCKRLSLQDDPVSDHIVVKLDQGADSHGFDLNSDNFEREFFYLIAITLNRTILCSKNREKATEPTVLILGYSNPFILERPSNKSCSYQPSPVIAEGSQHFKSPGPSSSHYFRDPMYLIPRGFVKDTSTMPFVAINTYGIPEYHQIPLRGSDGIIWTRFLELHTPLCEVEDKKKATIPAGKPNSKSGNIYPTRPGLYSISASQTQKIVTTNVSFAKVLSPREGLTIFLNEFFHLCLYISVPHLKKLELKRVCVQLIIPNAIHLPVDGDYAHPHLRVLARTFAQFADSEVKDDTSLQINTCSSNGFLNRLSGIDEFIEFPIAMDMRISDFCIPEELLAQNIFMLRVIGDWYEDGVRIGRDLIIADSPLFTLVKRDSGPFPTAPPVMEYPIHYIKKASQDANEVRKKFYISAFYDIEGEKFATSFDKEFLKGLSNGDQIIRLLNLNNESNDQACFAPTKQALLKSPPNRVFKPNLPPEKLAGLEDHESFCRKIIIDKCAKAYCKQLLENSKGMAKSPGKPLFPVIFHTRTSPRETSLGINCKLLPLNEAIDAVKDASIQRSNFFSSIFNSSKGMIIQKSGFEFFLESESESICEEDGEEESEEESICEDEEETICKEESEEESSAAED